MTRVLVIYKKSFFESHGSDAKLLRRVSPAERRRILRADAENRRTIEDVSGFLERQRARVSVVYRGSLAANPRYDLVVTVGGDGTFFAASHYVRRTPIIAINSNPENSLGIFSAADSHGFREPPALALSGRLPATRFNRLKAAINGKALRELVVNDLLFAHRVPASMTRYELGVDGRRELQRSSGLWIASASGSTAGIRAAGGARQPIESTKIQYVVREPYGWPDPHLRLLKGFAKKATSIRTLVTDSSIWIDGNRIHYGLALGDRVTVSSGAEPLVVLGFDDARRKRLFP